MPDLTAISSRAIHQPWTKAIYDAFKGALETGWVGLLGAFTFNSAAGAPTYVMNAPANLTTVLQPGDRIRLTQSAADKFFVVTAIAAGTITLYGGTDYVLANAAISNVVFSHAKAPVGFPLSPAKWTQTTKDTSARTQASPTSGTWYNLGSLSLLIPIGSWRVSYEVMIEPYNTAVIAVQRATLSTGTTTESDSDFTSAIYLEADADVSGFNEVGASVKRGPKILDLAAATTYYLNAMQNVHPQTQLAFSGNVSPTIIRAECAYL